MTEDAQSPILDEIVERMTTILRWSYPDTLTGPELARAVGANLQTVANLISSPTFDRHDRFERMGRRRNGAMLVRLRRAFRPTPEEQAAMAVRRDFEPAPMDVE